MSSNKTAISVRNLSKTYRLFGHPGDRIKQFFLLGLKQYHREYVALKDVSFDIHKGETVGIIGRNGSGKSTLLQAICGILKATSGTVRVDGKVSALLELGAGFNPEFTGTENVYFQGTLMGLSKEEMDQRFDDIVSFADIGEFIDQPVRSYSSGMYLRLAFSVAVNVDPDILVVDEALAVGDAGFRSRCFRRIGELRRKGCTILFVSHAMDQIISLCNRVLLLDEGKLLLFGQAEQAVEQYHHLQGARQKVRVMTDASVHPETCARYSGDDDSPNVDNATAYVSNGALIDSVRIVDEAGRSVGYLQRGRTYRCVFRVSFLQDAANVRCAVLLKSLDDFRLGGAMSVPTIDQGIVRVSQGSIADVAFEFVCILNPGIYFANVAVFASEASVEYALHGIDSALTFQVSPEQNYTAIGAVDFGFQATVQVTDEAAECHKQ